jgi:uroporphyrinogen-III decarboxylase
MRFTRQQYIDLMTFGEVDRQMFSELFGPLVGLDVEWRAQGATDDEINMIGFDWDYVPYVDCGGICTAFGTTPPETIEETAEHLIQRDFLGRTTKLCKGVATLPLPLDFPVKTPADWEAVKHFYVFDEARIDHTAVAKAAELQRQGYMVRAEIPGGWDIARELFGEEEACLAYYTQADLMRDILDTIRDTSVRVLERVTQEITIDQLFVHEDMAGKSGPLIGPATIREFIAPYYQACWEVVSNRGTRLFNQDSDGFMIPVIDAFLACGVNVMHPFEPAAGMDMVAVRKKYGHRLAILGGIDKHVLRKTKGDIDRELEYKMQPLMQEGGTVFSLDHRIPNGTPLENYRYYVKRGRELLGLPPLSRGGSTGWGRMAW